MVEESLFLDLGVVISLKDDGDEDLQEDHVDYEHIADKVDVGKSLAATADRHSASIGLHIVVRWVIDAELLDVVVYAVSCLNLVPIVTCRCYKQSYERIRESLKVYVGP